jgi:hypothetical protein
VATQNKTPIIGDKTPRPHGEAGVRMNTIIGAAGMGLDYVMRRKQGEGAVPALAKSVASGAFYNMVPWAFGAQLTYMAAKGVALGLPAVTNALIGVTAPARDVNFGGNYQDTMAAATMRQRGVQAINNSVMNSRSVLGQEARLMNRG